MAGMKDAGDPDSSDEDEMQEVIQINQQHNQDNLLRFSVHPYQFCVAADQILGIVIPPHLTRLPMSADEVAGLFMYQGELATCIDLRRKFALTERPADQTGQLLIGRTANILVAFWVDQVTDIINSDNLERQEIDISCAEQIFLGCYLHEQEIILQTSIDLLYVSGRIGLTQLLGDFGANEAGVTAHNTSFEEQAIDAKPLANPDATVETDVPDGITNETSTTEVQPSSQPDPEIMASQDNTADVAANQMALEDAQPESSQSDETASNDVVTSAEDEQYHNESSAEYLEPDPDHVDVHTPQHAVFTTAMPVVETQNQLQTTESTTTTAQSVTDEAHEIVEGNGEDVPDVTAPVTTVMTSPSLKPTGEISSISGTADTLQSNTTFSSSAETQGNAKPSHITGDTSKYATTQRIDHVIATSTGLVASQSDHITEAQTLSATRGATSPPSAGLDSPTVGHQEQDQPYEQTHDQIQPQFQDQHQILDQDQQQHQPSAITSSDLAAMPVSDDLHEAQSQSAPSAQNDVRSHPSDNIQNQDELAAPIAADSPLPDSTYVQSQARRRKVVIISGILLAIALVGFIILLAVWLSPLIVSESATSQSTSQSALSGGPLQRSADSSERLSTTMAVTATVDESTPGSGGQVATELAGMTEMMTMSDSAASQMLQNGDVQKPASASSEQMPDDSQLQSMVAESHQTSRGISPDSGLNEQITGTNEIFRLESDSLIVSVERPGLTHNWQDQETDSAPETRVGGSAQNPAQSSAQDSEVDSAGSSNMETVLSSSRTVERQTPIDGAVMQRVTATDLSASDHVSGRTTGISDQQAVPKPVNDAVVSTTVTSDESSVSAVTLGRHTVQLPLQSGKTIVHRVQRGDNLWNIAKHYLNDPLRYMELAQVSQIRNPDLIYPGDIIRIYIK